MQLVATRSGRHGRLHTCTQVGGCPCVHTIPPAHLQHTSHTSHTSHTPLLLGVGTGLRLVVATGSTTYISTLAEQLSQARHPYSCQRLSTFVGWPCTQHVWCQQAPLALLLLLPAGVTLNKRAPSPLRTHTCPQKPPNAFQRGVHRVSWLLLAFMAAMVPLVVLFNGLMTADWAQVGCICRPCRLPLHPRTSRDAPSSSAAWPRLFR